MRKTKIGIVGLHQSGKSLLINCLLKRFISKVGTGSATTHAPVSYSYSDDEYAEYLDSTGWHVIEIKDVANYDSKDSICKINVHLNNSLLKAFTLVDLPGTGYNDNDNSTTSKVLHELDFAILLATDVKEFSNSSSFYTNTLLLLQRYNIPYYFILNCTNITKWSPLNKQNIEVAKSDLELLHIYEPLSLGETDDYPLVNLIWYWCSIAIDSDEIYLKYCDSIQNYFERKGKSWNRQSLEADSNFRIVQSIFNNRNRTYIELMRDFRKELARLKEELCPIGTIQTFAFENIQQGWVICDGKSLKIEDYPELFNTIGTTFGGNGTDEFKVPDLRNQFVRGWSKNSKRKFGSIQDDAIQGHSHKIKPLGNTSTAGGHSHQVYYRVYKVGSNWGENDMPVWEIPSSADTSKKGGDPGTTSSGSHSHSLPDFITENLESMKSFGTVRQAKETRPTNMALLYCIKAQQ